jgi:hypothetical protein
MTPIELHARNSKVVPENTCGDSMSVLVSNLNIHTYLTLLEVAFSSQPRVIV